MAIFHVIDDEQFMCDLISKMLAMHGHETFAFRDPHRYLQFLDDAAYVAPAAVITDVLMPNMDGYELIDTIIRRNSAQKFIIISGTPYIDLGIQHKACHYLCKPFRAKGLIDIVDALTSCDRDGPSSKLGCADMGDRERFMLEWHCPMPETTPSR